MKRFNNNKKIVISLIMVPILVYLITGFLTTFDITKWNPGIKVEACLKYEDNEYRTNTIEEEAEDIFKEKHGFNYD